METGGVAVASEMFHTQQKSDQQAVKAIMYFALFGGMILGWIISANFGQTAGELCFLVGFVWYVLGYSQCKRNWKIEKEAAEFYEAYSAYEKEPLNGKR